MAMPLAVTVAGVTATVVVTESKKHRDILILASSFPNADLARRHFNLSCLYYFENVQIES